MKLQKQLFICLYQQVPVLVVVADVVDLDLLIGNSLLVDILIFGCRLEPTF
jgi:hypothetical protein